MRQQSRVSSRKLQAIGTHRIKPDNLDIALLGYRLSAREGGTVRQINADQNHLQK